LKIRAYSDSDYAGDVIDRKNTTGFVIMYAGGPIAWCSKKQNIVALLSTEVEYIAAAECVKEILYVKTLMFELIDRKVSIELNVDNQSAMKLIKSGKLNRNSKNIDIRYHYICDKMNEGLFDLKYCPSEDQLADTLTKPLSKIKLVKCRNAIMSNV
jgi:hypothetical protein